MPKPVNFIDGTIALPQGEDAIWAALLELQRQQMSYTLQEIEKACKADEASIREYLRRLLKSGHVQVVGSRPARKPSKGKALLYAIMKTSIDAPRVRRDGSPVPEAAIDRMWRVMRMMKAFSAHDLSEAAKVSTATAERYLRHLSEGDSPIVRHDAAPLARRTYMVTRQLGPRAPKILRGHVVYDPNARVIVGAVQTEELVL